jgi:hypothetical protein
MSASDTLGLSAELAIALLGFAAIASILHSSGRITAPDGRFWGMVASGFVSLIASLVPIPFLHADIEASQIWAYSSSFLGAAIIGLCAFSVRTLSKANDSSGAPTNWPIFVFFVSLLLGGSAICFYNAMAVATAGFPMYFGAIVILHIVTAALFVRLLVVWLSSHEST